MSRVTAVEYLRRPENTTYLVMLSISVVISLLGFFTDIFKVNQNIVYLCSATLMVLSGITFVTLITHNVITHLKERFENPNIDETMHPFRSFHDEIKENIERAEEIWLISRTGRGWWKYYFENLLRNNDKNTFSARFLFIDPDSPAVDMIKAGSVPIWEDPNATDLKISMKNFYEMFGKEIDKNKKIRNKDEGILRVMNYLPPWTLLIINPLKRNKHSVVYVELGRYTADYLSRDTFKILPGMSPSYDTFIQEFNKVWFHKRLTKKYSVSTEITS